jgi:probable phosphoglycerate mutase
MLRYLSFQEVYMTTRIYLIRHGATEASSEDRFSGRTDIELSAEGRFQANRLSERLADNHIIAIFTSPMKRTFDTARRIHLPSLRWGENRASV